MKISLLQKQRGFTLIEMIVSLALFSVVVTITVGSLLMLIGGNSRLTGEQIIVDSLSFALDSMTREIRTGTSYNCNTGTFATQEILGTVTRNCATGATAISFIESGISITGATATRIAYYYDSINQTIMRRVGNNAAQAIISDNVVVTKLEFFVTGAAPLGTGTEALQPTVTIVIEATDTESSKPFIMQTTVVQRTLDV